jgi:hypothetical protein
MVRMRDASGQLSQAKLLTLTRNRGELAEGWYDPSTLQKAIASSVESQEKSRDVTSRNQESRPNRDIGIGERSGKSGTGSGSESDESVGPTLPGKEGRSMGSRMGPSIPKGDDLELKRGATSLNFLLQSSH